MNRISIIKLDHPEEPAEPQIGERQSPEVQGFVCHEPAVQFPKILQFSLQAAVRSTGSVNPDDSLFFSEINLVLQLFTEVSFLCLKTEIIKLDRV